MPCKLCFSYNSIFKFFKKIALTGLFLIISNNSFAQYTSKELNPYHKAYHDSLQSREYPYRFPILAKQAYKKGFDVPFTYGLSTAYYTQVQDVNIKRTLIGLNDLEPVDLSDFIKFGTVEARTEAYTVRPDMWVLPFLNIYGIFGVGSTSTAVPLVRPVDFSTTQHFSVTSAGFGFTVAGGFGPLFFVVDNNFNFGNVEALVEPVPAHNLDIRLGHNFVNPRRADRGLAVWFGAFRQNINGDTNGSITIKDLFPNGTEGLQDGFIDRLHEWADGLPPGQKLVANQIIDKIDDHLSGVDVGDAQITYALDKELAKPWNLIFGAQYQHNKHWQLRTELGTFGKRTSFLIMVNYRFESLFNKK
ncbi:hypothetical protein NO995_10475 [Aestuariibaculum sp. M13]|uniref:hypothetical protein n=1 Tax=Aestuariibaculum sp. M13 TaxID=2967132 RepID=UPI002159FD20|nr:hypothetical protein [Aestuariibaculum sp. M13]MCR8668108.1 hypothetical protein [Aestuariibaculum sp. M13]